MLQMQIVKYYSTVMKKINKIYSFPQTKEERQDKFIVDFTIPLTYFQVRIVVVLIKFECQKYGSKYKGEWFTLELMKSNYSKTI